MIKLFGILDIAASILLFLAAFNILLPWQLYFAFGIYLALKGIIFIKSFISIVDIACGILLFAVIQFNVPQAVLIIAAIILLQKGVFSMLSH